MDETVVSRPRPAHAPADDETEYPWERHGSLRSRVLDYDPVLKRTTVFWYDEYAQTQRLVEHWDIGDIIEANKADYAATDEHAPWRGGSEHELGTFVGRIPLAIAFDVLKKTGWGRDRKAVSKWLTDPNNRHFLARPVRFGI